MPDKQELLRRARELRQNMTPQERKLWYEFLRTYPVKFYKQHIIGPYIADFYCPSARLVIELDGGQHYQEEALLYDEQRRLWMAGQGLHTLCYTNHDVTARFPVVCADIEISVQNRLNKGV